MIKDLSTRRRLPRLGKIKLGVIVGEGKSAHPKAVDYFVCPPEVQEALGEKQPKALPILLPLDDPEKVFPQEYKMYKTSGLFCAGDGVRARRWDDTGNLQERECPCPYLENGMCGPVATLNFLLPDVPGIGVWQITTGSQRSIISLNSALETFQKTFGGLAGIPFTLKLEDEQIQRFDEQKKGMVKQVIHVLRLDSPVTMRQILEWRQKMGKPVEALMPAPEAEEAEIVHHAAGIVPPESVVTPARVGGSESSESGAPAEPAGGRESAPPVGGGEFTLEACKKAALAMGVSPTLWGRYLVAVPFETQAQIADLWAALDAATRSQEAKKVLLQAMTLAVNKSLKKEKS